MTHRNGRGSCLAFSILLPAFAHLFSVDVVVISPSILTACPTDASDEDGGENRGKDSCYCCQWAAIQGVERMKKRRGDG